MENQNMSTGPWDMAASRIQAPWLQGYDFFLSTRLFLSGTWEGRPGWLQWPGVITPLMVLGISCCAFPHDWLHEWPWANHLLLPCLVFFHRQSTVSCEDQSTSWLEMLLKRRKGNHVFWILFGQRTLTYSKITQHSNHPSAESIIIFHCLPSLERRCHDRWLGWAWSQIAKNSYPDSAPSKMCDFLTFDPPTSQSLHEEIILRMVGCCEITYTKNLAQYLVLWRNQFTLTVHSIIHSFIQ